MSVSVDTSAVNSAVSTSANNAASAAATAASLQAQVDQYQHQLSDCVNCDSSKTAEGKQQIEEISNKIAATKQRIQELTTAQRPNANSGSQSVQGHTVRNAEPTSQQVNVSTQAPTSVSQSADSSTIPKDKLSNVGTIVDTRS